MAVNNYFVSVDRGDDATGDGSAATPWKSIGKAIGSSPAASLGSDGARIYIEPGIYYEAVTLGLTPTVTAPLEIVGDCDGAGFYAGGYATPATGIVDWSAWISDSQINFYAALNGNDKSHVTVRRLKMYGGATSENVGSCIEVGAGTDWTLVDCGLIANTTSRAGVWARPTGGGANLLIDRCVVTSGGRIAATGVTIYAVEAAAEYNLGVTIRNCRFFGGGASSSRGVSVERAATTGLGKLGVGVAVEHCTFFGFNVAARFFEGVAITTTGNSTVAGCVFFCSGTGIAAGHTSQVAENYNAFHVYTPRTNVAAGAASTINIRPAMDFGDGLLTGTPLQPFGTPTVGSPLGGFVTGGSPPALDATGRARPEGLGTTNAAAGALERHDTGDANATYAPAGSAACLALKGPSSLERPILVDAAATTIGVQVRWDGNHGDANKPRAILLANPEIGITADQTLTATGSGGSGSTPNAYQTLTFSPVTPTKAGALVIRLVSRSAAGNGVAYFAPAASGATLPTDHWYRGGLTEVGGEPSSPPSSPQPAQLLAISGA